MRTQLLPNYVKSHRLLHDSAFRLGWWPAHFSLPPMRFSCGTELHIQWDCQVSPHLYGHWMNWFVDASLQHRLRWITEELETKLKRVEGQCNALIGSLCLSNYILVKWAAPWVMPTTSGSTVCKIDMFRLSVIFSSVFGIVHSNLWNHHSYMQSVEKQSRVLGKWRMLSMQLPMVQQKLGARL